MERCFSAGWALVLFTIGVFNKAARLSGAVFFLMSFTFSLLLYNKIKNKKQPSAEDGWDRG